jgi:hypothetical protein
MRLRATRLTAASNPRRRLLDPARLYQTAGRVGVCYTSDTGGVSWDDLIAENMRALGPELVVNGSSDAGPIVFPNDGFIRLASKEQSSDFHQDGEFSTKLTSVPGSGSHYWVFGLIPANTAIRVSGSVYVPTGATSGQTIRAVDRGDGSFVLDLLTTSQFGQWVNFSFVRAGKATAWDLSFGNNLSADWGSASIYFDNISVREIDLSKCTLYHDSAGTVPVVYPIAAGQGMGFLRDRSAGSALGAELLAFGSPSTGVSVSGSSVTFDGTQASAQSIAITAGSTASRFYELQFTAAVTSGSYRVRQTGQAGTFVSTSGVFRVVVSAITGLGFEVQSNTTGNLFVGTISNISVRELPGFPLSQPTLSARGEFSRRFNQLLATATLSTQSVTTIATTYRLLFSGAGTVTLSGTATGTLSAGSHTITATAGTLTLTVSGAVTEADLRFSADAHIGKPYQRVTSASDYDEEGFPTYLRRQTDDWARAFAVSPNGATKALCFWAGQKMSDAATGIAFETSPDGTTGNPGAVALAAPSLAGANSYRATSRGAGGLSTAGTGVFAPAPGRHVARTQSDIPNDVNQLYINGTLAESSTTDQGTGPYLTYDLFEGARNGTSLFSNTRTYTPPMLMFIQPADPGPTDSEIARLEAKYLRAAGVVS